MLDEERMSKLGQYYLGIDVGSVSTNLVLLDSHDTVYEKVYLRTKGKPIDALLMGLKHLASHLHDRIEVLTVGTTGSGRHLAATILGADIIKNEITTHAIAALSQMKAIQTIFEIGGQDSKIIIIREGVVTDFAMNTVCAAGTGSFLDRQAERLGIPIEKFGRYALLSQNPVRIAGRCAVFAESDMIHKQQLGCTQEDIISGLCEALVRNYLNNVGKGKSIRDKIIFQGGVAANEGIRVAFEKELDTQIYIPEHYDVMGAIGAAILAKNLYRSGYKSMFKGFDIIHNRYITKGIECNDCSNQCEIVEINSNESVIARWGDRCGKWSAMDDHNTQNHALNAERLCRK